MYEFKTDLSTGSLTDKQIKDILTKFNSSILPNLERKLQYYKVKNSYIKYERVTDASSGAPDFKIAVSYARKIVDTAAGYMYKPGNVKYTVESAKYETVFKDINKANQETLRTSVLGKNTGIYGVAYELHYLDVDKGNQPVPMFYPADPREIIPIWNYDINPKLVAFIRTYKKGETVVVEVYYSNAVDTYTHKQDHQDIYKDFKLESTADNVYGQPNLVVYPNNEEGMSDFDPVIDLINAYDVLASDAMNEIDRFAWAYLLLAGQRLDPEDARAVKFKRMFEDLESTDQVKFLTKDINDAFISMMKDWIKDEIHKQSHVPDFLDSRSGAQTSGAALDRLLFDFEFIAATKEMYFRQGLYNRYKLIDKIVNFSDSDYIVDDIKITMDRNKPTDKEVDARVYNLYYQKGITDITLMENFAKFVDDPEAEKKAFDEDEESRIEPIEDMDIEGETIEQTATDNSVEEQIPGDTKPGGGRLRKES